MANVSEQKMTDLQDLTERAARALAALRHNKNAKDFEQFFNHMKSTYVEDAIAAIAAMNEWSDISSAPDWKPGRKVWVIGGIYEEPTVVAPDADYWRMNVGKIGSIPTHWAPFHVPKPPASPRT